MFEKESEEYLKKDGTKAEQILNMLNEISPLKITSKQLPFILAMLKQIFQDGSEFGYNKAKEDAEKMKSRFLELCNLKDMRIAELEKANEWHYVKDGDLPKVNELVLIKITGCFVLGWTNGTNWFNDSNNGTIIDRRMVIAWKEIVLPKEIE
jgi:flagellar biosynthesis/type III secretory pathway protein FliH